MRAGPLSIEAQWALSQHLLSGGPGRGVEQPSDTVLVLTTQLCRRIAKADLDNCKQMTVAVFSSNFVDTEILISYDSTCHKILFFS